MNNLVKVRAMSQGAFLGYLEKMCKIQHIRESVSESEWREKLKELMSYAKHDCAFEQNIDEFIFTIKVYPQIVAFYNEYTEIHESILIDFELVKMKTQFFVKGNELIVLNDEFIRWEFTINEEFVEYVKENNITFTDVELNALSEKFSLLGMAYDDGICNYSIDIEDLKLDGFAYCDRKEFNEYFKSNF